MRHSVGIDVGGTFTDFVALNDDGSVVVEKQLTSPDDPSISVLSGVQKLGAKAESPLSEASRIVHGTTIVANSLIERRGARTALICTAGFRDVLEIGRESRYDVYDLELRRPEPLVPRPLRLEVRERIRADGSVLEPLALADGHELVRVLKEQRIESVGVSLLNAYVNDAHERALAEFLAEHAPDVDVSWSSAISPEWREYERTSSVAANAFVRPLVRHYLARLEAGFGELGGGGRLYVMLSNGGLTSADVASELAVQLVESGPAGGVIAAAFFAERLGIGSVISLDMGGTTAKVSLVEDGVPLQSPEIEVARVARFRRGSGLPLRVPSIELVEIGAGGGSLGHVDALGLLKVGPRSAGAAPGPACYGRGGSEPTVTDADLYLGYLNPDFFLGGEMRLRRDLAEAALAELGAKTELTAEQCARGMFNIVNQQMALAVRTHIVELGRDPRGYALLASGGAGPVHAYEVARSLHIQSVISPPAAGVASALGFLVAPVRVDLSATHPMLLTDVDAAAVEAIFGPMEDRASDLLRRSGVEPADVERVRHVDMRYAGQGYMVSVPIRADAHDALLERGFRQGFEEAYRKRFGSHLTDAAVEFVHWRLSARADIGPTDVRFTPAASGTEMIKGEREVYFPEVGGYVTSTVYDRYALQPGTNFDGPALIEERESTTVVGPSGAVHVDDLGSLVISLSYEASAAADDDAAPAADVLRRAGM